MQTKRNIVLYLRRLHDESHRTTPDWGCPFCQRKRDNAHRLIATFHESPMMEIVDFHVKHWERLGAPIANRANAHQLPATLVADVLTRWIAMQVDLPDSPEDYIDHPRVLELFDRQKNDDSE
jgi:hypothetical protein